MERTFCWEIEEMNIRTDHKMVSVSYMSEDAPEIGKGRWVMPTHILYDREVKEFLQMEGNTLLQKMDEVERADKWDANNNVPSLWAEFKTKFISLARQRAKIIIPRIEKDIKETKIKMNLETISRYWTKRNREQKPHALIWRLEKLDISSRNATGNDNNENEQNGPIFEKSSRAMADMMKNHHKDIQQDDLPVDEENRGTSWTD
ncbi:hypothetical protein F5880DRAFT_1512960, partial [Lentinula raphanica]